METDIRKKKILFVEDEMGMRFFLKTLAQAGGFNAVMAKNGQEGIQKAKEEKPDLVILDVMMPEEGGTLMYRNLKIEEDLRRIPVIILSGVAKKTFFHYLIMMNAQQKNKIPDPDAYIEKPPEPDHLLDTINRLLQRSGSRKNW